MNLKEDRKKAILQKLKVEPMNRLQLATDFFCSSQLIDFYLAELKANKEIYIAFYSRTMGKPSPYFSVGNKPDAPRPKAMTQPEREAHLRERKLKMGVLPKVEEIELVEEKFEPRRDIASSWF